MPVDLEEVKVEEMGNAASDIYKNLSHSEVCFISRDEEKFELREVLFLMG